MDLCSIQNLEIIKIATKYDSKNTLEIIVGLVAFVVAIPNPGYAIRKIYIRDIRSGIIQPEENAFIKLKPGIQEPSCTESECLLGFSHDFTSSECHELNTIGLNKPYKQGWFGGASVKEQIGGTTRRPRYKFDTSGWCAHHPTQGPMLFDNIPSKQSIDLVGSKMMPVYAISKRPVILEKNVGCTKLGGK